MTSSKIRESYSRSIKPYDLVLSKYDKAMSGFKPSASYTVTFWYRPQKKAAGEIFNFGDSVDMVSTEPEVSKQYYAPAARVAKYGEQGVELHFTVSTTMDRFWTCKGVPSKSSKTKAEAAVLPFRKWTYVAITVTTATTGTTAAVYYDNQMSGLQKAVSGDESTTQGKLAEINKCVSGAGAFVPESSKHGYSVSSYFPASDKPSDNKANVADVAGLTYYNKALSVADLAKMYEFEQHGVRGWSTTDARSRNNGVCGA